MYCGGLRANGIDGELYWADDRARSSSQFSARLLAREEDNFGQKQRSGSPKGHHSKMGSSLAAALTHSLGRPQNKTGYFPEAGHGPASLLHATMTSSQPAMDHDEREEYYNRTYPYNYLQLKDLKDTAASVERVYTIQALTGAEQSKTMEAVILALRYLEDTERQNLKRCLFIDLMAHGAEAVLYASAFGFDRMITLELSERSKNDAIRIIRQIPGLVERCTVLVGSFHDYFPCDAQIYYMDCCRVVDCRKIGDEGILLDKVFTLFRTLLPGSFLVLLTNLTNFDAAKDFKAPWMRRLLKATVHHGHPDQSTLWIYGL